MKTNIKMRVTPEQSKKVYKIAGYSILTERKGNHYVFVDSYGNISWDDIEYGEKHHFIEVDADLFIRTNGTCEEEPHAELKRKYESGEYICIYPLDDTWITTYEPIWAESVDYKLVHKRHKEVLEYLLNGGDIEVLREDELCLDNPYFWKKCTKNFIESYHERKIYRIKQDQPQTRTFATKKELAEALIRGEKWKDKYGFICYFSEESNNPFFASDGEKGFILDNQQWEQCDGKTLWTKVND